MAERRLLYTLVDAANYFGLIADPTLRKRATETRDRVERAGFEVEALRMFDLLEDLDRNGAIAGTWIEERWRAAKKRVDPSAAVPLRPR